MVLQGLPVAHSSQGGHPHLSSQKTEQCMLFGFNLHADLSILQAKHISAAQLGHLTMWQPWLR